MFPAKLERDLNDLMDVMERSERNRQNAQKSTGPKTPEGKATSRMNALRHGLCATVALVLPGEDANAFETLKKGIYDSFKPVDLAEEVLVDQYISTSWKLRRIADAEETLNQREAGRSHPRTIGEQLLDEAKATSDSPRLKLLAIEDRLQRMLGRTLRQLKEVRGLRATRGEELAEAPVEPPVRQENAAPPKPPEEAPPVPVGDVKCREMSGYVAQRPMIQNEAGSDGVAPGRTEANVQNEPTALPVEPRIRTLREIAGY